MRKSASLNIRLEPEIRQQLDRLSKIEQRSVCEMGRRALRLGLRDLNKIVIVRLRQEGIERGIERWLNSQSKKR